MSSLEYYPPFSPKYSHDQYIKLENLQIVSPSEDVKIINVLGHYSREYGISRIVNSDFSRKKKGLNLKEPKNLSIVVLLNSVTLSVNKEGHL